MSMSTFSIPDQFEAREKAISHHKMNLVVDENKFGRLVQKKVNGGISFELQDLKKNTVAVAHKKQFDFGSSIQIYDMYGGLMGSIQHKVHNPLTNPLQKYSIFNAYGALLATTKQQDDIDRFITLFDKEGSRVFSMRRSPNFMKDNWSVQIGLGLDKRLAVFLPAFVSSELGKEML